MKRICFFTGSRSEYYLLRPLMQAVADDPVFDLRIIVSGSHLSPFHGQTIRNIEQDGLPVNERVEVLLSSDSPVGQCKSIGLGLISISEAIDRLQPDILVILGDRYESFAAASAGCMLNVFIAHLHGGELTGGAVDDSLRHAVTKMSHLHFVATEVYRKRVIQLGEQPDSVIHCGALGLTTIRQQLLPRDILENELEFDFSSPCMLVTFHPVTRQRDYGFGQVKELVAALDDLGAVNILFTGTNADFGGQKISNLVDKFVSRHSGKVKCVHNLGQLRYFSALQYVDVVVGNSSSGLIEAPSFGVPVVNIGDRQQGRVAPGNVINVEPARRKIYRACQQALSREFREHAGNVENPYFMIDTIKIIIEKLKKVDPEQTKKKFYDVKAEQIL